MGAYAESVVCGRAGEPRSRGEARKRRGTSPSEPVS
jgi:hypothetical protein